jgi:hypothetical protein
MRKARVLNLLNVSFAVILILHTAGCSRGNGQIAKPGPAPAKVSDYKWERLTKHAAYPPGYNYPVFVANGRMIAMHAQGIWDSTDGKTWRKSDLPSIRENVYRSEYVQFRNAIYAFGDNDGNYQQIRFNAKIRRTTDLKKWETLKGTSNLPGRIFAGWTAFRGKVWLLGGYDGKRFYNDVWNSSDGVRWQLVTSDAKWSPRTISGVVEFKDHLYIVGGGVIDGMHDDYPDSDRETWSSADGITWTKAPENMPIRAGGAPVVFDDKLWLVGANRDGSFARSSLVTEDGFTWKEVEAPWSPRGGAAAWVFDGKLYMTGGKYSDTENGRIRFIYSNDVWVMSKEGG